MESTPATNLVELRGVTRVFGSGRGLTEALRGVDLDVAEGEYLAIQGRSGSGKSTLLQIIGLLDAPSTGSHRFRGRPVEALPERERTRLRNEEIGFVFQAFHLLRDRSALENVRLPLDYRRGGAAPARDPRDMLERFGLGERLDHRPGQLSGGEQQRVAIARALVKCPRLLICDEPTGNLDHTTGLEVLDLLDEIHCAEGVTVLLVTHDEQVAARAGRRLVLEDGRWLAAPEMPAPATAPAGGSS